jgi:hypothetical protein
MNRKAISGMAALLCISAFAAVTAGASAATFESTNEACTGGTKFNLCYEGLNKLKVQGKWELTGEQTVEVKQLSVGIFKVPQDMGTTVTIDCKKLKQGTKEANVAIQLTPLSTNGTTKGTLIFEECAITAPKTAVEDCEIPASRETLPLSGELTSETNLRLKPTAGEDTAFLPILFSNKGAKVCFLKGTKNVTGFQDIEILKAITAEKTKKGRSVELSGLKCLEETASLSGELEESYPGLANEVYVSKEA